jgi:hypothetical protein
MLDNFGLSFAKKEWQLGVIDLRNQLMGKSGAGEGNRTLVTVTFSSVFHFVIIHLMVCQVIFYEKKIFI